MRAALLLRVSAPRQVDGLSLDAQRHALRGLCGRQGWAVVREYVGLGESAYTNDIRKRQTVLDLKHDASSMSSTCSLSTTSAASPAMKNWDTPSSTSCCATTSTWSMRTATSTTGRRRAI